MILDIKIIRYISVLVCAFSLSGRRGKPEAVPLPVGLVPKEFCAARYCRVESPEFTLPADFPGKRLYEELKAKVDGLSDEEKRKMRYKYCCPVGVIETRFYSIMKCFEEFVGLCDKSKLDLLSIFSSLKTYEFTSCYYIRPKMARTIIDQILEELRKTPNEVPDDHILFLSCLIHDYNLARTHEPEEAEEDLKPTESHSKKDDCELYELYELYDFCASDVLRENLRQVFMKMHSTRLSYLVKETTKDFCQKCFVVIIVMRQCYDVQCSNK